MLRSRLGLSLPEPPSRVAKISAKKNGSMDEVVGKKEGKKKKKKAPEQVYKKTGLI